MLFLKGLQEPFAKRTVEGDLGMRYSAEGVLQSMSNREIYQYKKKVLILNMKPKNAGKM